MLKALKEWIPNEDFVCGWSEGLRIHENEIAFRFTYIHPVLCDSQSTRIFPKNVRENQNWRVIFDTHILCMKTPEIRENTHLRILLQSSGDTKQSDHRTYAFSTLDGGGGSHRIELSS